MKRLRTSTKDNQDEEDDDFQPPINLHKRRKPQAKLATASTVPPSTSSNTTSHNEDFQPPILIHQRSNPQTKLAVPPSTSSNTTSHNEDFQPPILIHQRSNPQTKPATTSTKSPDKSNSTDGNAVLHIYESKKIQTTHTDTPTEDLNDLNVYTSCKKAKVDYDKYHKKVGFCESLSNTVAWLKSFGLETQQLGDLQSNELMLTQLIKVLNKKEEPPFVMKAVNMKNSKEMPTTGVFYMYGMAKKHACEIIVFSTRKSPFTVTPSVSWCSFDIPAVNRSDIPTIAVLEHKDSYLGRATYYVLKQNDGFVISETPKVKNEDHEHFFATKIQDKHQRARAERFVFTPEEKARVNESIYNLVIQETKTKLQERWIEFLKQKLRCKSTESTITSTLDLQTEFVIEEKGKLKTSIPNGVLPIVKKKIEQTLVAHPSSSSWVSNYWGLYSKSRNFNIHDIIDEFKSEISGCDITFRVEEIPEDMEKTESGEEQRMVSRTLKAVLKDNVDHGLVLATLKELQTTCTRCIDGLCKIVVILMNMILNGEIIKFLRDTTQKTIKFFDLKKSKNAVKAPYLFKRNLQQFTMSNN